MKCETPDSNDSKVIAKIKGFRYMYVGQSLKVTVKVARSINVVCTERPHHKECTYEILKQFLP